MPLTGRTNLCAVVFRWTVRGKENDSAHRHDKQASEPTAVIGLSRFTRMLVKPSKEVGVIMTREEIARARWLFGPAPILTSEEPERFEEFFTQLANGLKPQDVTEVMLIWQFTVDSWLVNRAIRHAAVAIERRYVEGVRLKLQRARLLQAQKKGEITAEIRSSIPTDIAALAELEETISSTVDDMDEIHKRKASEREHNIAFEKSMAFQEQLDRLISSATRRRDDALKLLEIYRAGLGAQAQATAEQILDGECQEVIPMPQAPALTPPNEELPLVPKRLSRPMSGNDCQGR